MRIVPQPFFFAGILTCLALFLTESSLHAQGANSKREEFETADGVTLYGTWYPSNQANAPVCLLLHNLGEDRSKNEWVALAEKLQKEGFAVFTFDFRGHGESVNASPKFWGYGANRGSNATRGSQLDFKNFSKSYYPYLINDISAAKALLDQKNDANQCNSSSVILVGAEEGALLGAIWLNSEWHRYRMLPPSFGMGPVPDLNHPYGKDVVACVWLSFTNRLGGLKTGVRISPEKLFTRSALQNTTPMVFFHNPSDEWDKAIAEYHEKMIHKFNQNIKKDLVRAIAIPKAGKLKGRALLQPPLPTAAAVVEYVKKAPKINIWNRHDFRNTQYVWVIGNQIVPINMVGATTLGFHDYSTQTFMPR